MNYNEIVNKITNYYKQYDLTEIEKTEIKSTAYNILAELNYSNDDDILLDCARIIQSLAMLSIDLKESDICELSDLMFTNLTSNEDG